MESRHARQYRLLLEDLAAKHGADTPEQREAIYERARRSNERLIETHSEKLSEAAVDNMRRSLEDIVAEFEAAAAGADEEAEPQAFDDFGIPSPAEPVPTGAPRQVLQLPSLSTIAASPLALGVGAGVAGMAVLLFLMALLGVVSFGGQSRLAEIDAKLDESKPAYDRLIGFMREVETTMEQRLVAEPEATEELVGRRFVFLDEAVPELSALGEDRVPQGTRIGLRASRTGIKVTANTLLCTYARLREPENVDPRRDPGGVGCSVIAVYNEGGREF